MVNTQSTKLANLPSLCVVRHIAPEEEHVTKKNTDSTDQADDDENAMSKQWLRNQDCLTQLSARYPFSRESSVENFISDESYHRLLCNFLHGSLTKNFGLPNIKYIQKLDNSIFLLSALKCRIVWSVSQTRSSLSSAVISLNPELILRKKKQEQQF